ncbi:mycothiol synthase [Actinophytocola algeriensis]|uniref:Mycothiol acetyltransferase n=1 Tax=Actinophytocola algeriensis TaxID=1768010 RepID=A0A7W7Q423_9PSEU|nr:mycothiol synthase [Actinophytocola algeriensis]MBE1477934.1 mycothiol synthase [Actinophytocola algeriensis]
MLAAVREADGVPEASADGALPPEFRTGRHLVAWDGGTTVGYAHVDQRGDAFGNQIIELFVHPAHRRRGIGTALVDEVLTIASPLRLWSHRDHPGAARIAERRDLARVRELLQMRLDNSVELPVQTNPGVTVRTFMPGRDEQAVVDVNKRAFDWHPEQGMLTVADVEATEKEPWFDPGGFFLAVDEQDKVVGFHWTKVHPDGTGEVYVVGIHPDAQGGGLGRALTLTGLHHLRGLGVSEIILYVESDNAPALAVYRRLGFSVAYTNVAYQR